MYSFRKEIWESNRVLRLCSQQSPQSENPRLEGLNSGKFLFTFSAHEYQEAEKEVCARQGFLTLQVLQYQNEMEGYLGRHYTCRDIGGKQENTE